MLMDVRESKGADGTMLQDGLSVVGRERVREEVGYEKKVMDINHIG